MTARSAVIFLPNDAAKTGAAKPMMLQRILGVPLLKWLVYSLRQAGLQRCFLVSSPEFLPEAKRCFPKDVALTCADGEQVPDQMHVFLSTAQEQEQQVLVITAPVVLIPQQAVLCEDQPLSDAPSGAYRVLRTELMSALDEKFSFMGFLEKHGCAKTEREGFFPVSTLADLPDWQPVLKRMPLDDLTAAGVEIWDYDNCFVDPFVTVGAGTALLPGTILQGATRVGKDCKIGPNALLEDAELADGVTVNASQVYRSSIGSGTKVGPFAYIRPDCRIGENIRIGDFVEVKNSTIGNGTKVSHLTYIGDSDVGERINFGCGTVTVNYDRAEKFRTVIEDDAFIGCNANLIAPVTVGRGAYIAAGSTITDPVPDRALAIARSRQSNKKDWSSKHKLKRK